MPVRLLLCSLFAIAATLQAASFTPGNIVVYRVGDGASALANTGAVVFLDEFTPTGTLVQSLPMPTVASGAHKRLVASGTAGSEGFLQRSSDGRYLVATGYDSDLPAAATISSTSAARVIGRIDASGGIDTSTALIDAATSDNPRSAASLNGSAFWFGGGTGGVRYATLGATASTDLTSTSVANIRQPAIFGGQLYLSSQIGTNTFKGVSAVGTGLPTASGQTVTRLAGLLDSNSAAANMFFMADLSSSEPGVDLLYIADENGVTGGLTKFSLVGGTWTANGKVGLGSDNYRGLTGAVLGSTVTLYATRANGAELVSLVDSSGHNAAITALPNVLSTAQLNTAYRGVALAPQAMLPDLITAVSAPVNASTGVSFAYTVQVSNAGTASASGIVCRFTLPAGLSFGNSTGSHGFSGSHSAGIVTFSGGSLLAGAQATLTVNVSTNTAATYTAAAGTALVDPTSAIAEANETNNGNPTSAVTVVSAPNTPPSFSQHPAAVTIANGATATLGVTVVGNPVPTLQWYQGLSGDTSQPVSSTGTGFTTPPLFLNTSYWVRATNGSGSVNSNAALVTVTPSTNADLSAVTADFIPYPIFAAATTSYVAFVSNTTTGVSVTPTSASVYSSIQVNGTAVTSGEASQTHPLVEGANTIAIQVTAQDGTTTKTYTFTIHRSAPPQAAGAIAFVGYNADGDDDLAFVLLSSIPANSVIHFSDNEWNGQPLGAGGAFADFAESEFVWMPPPGGLAAGNVVVLSNLANVTTASIGSFFGSDGAGRGFSTTAETVHAFMGGTRSPSAFLAAISTDGAITLAGTGLAAGSTAVQLGTASDGAAYVGARSGETAFSAYRPLIGNAAANWTDVGDGDGITLLPFATTSFSLTGSPIYTHTNRDVLAPNHDVWDGLGVSLEGLQFTNLGLQGVGRVPSNLINATTGETVGSISDLQVTGFVSNGNGSYSGTFHFMPDRGYSAGGINPNTAARINRFTFTFTPYTAATATTLQNQILMSFAGFSRFTHDHDGSPTTADVFTTGIAPTANDNFLGAPAPRAGFPVTQADGVASRRLSITGEGLVLDRRSGRTGSGWVSDEFGPGIYHFDSSYKLDGRLGIPAAIIPRASGGNIDFGTETPSSGRRENQGFEGLAQSPDGSRLFAMLQSATVQDSGTGNEGRFNTRILVYDLSAGDSPAAPEAQYVIQLPRIDDTGSGTNGTSVNRTGTQCALVALSNSTLLLLSRDGNGRGSPGDIPVFKSVLLADLRNATDIAAGFDAAGEAVAPFGALEPAVTPVPWTQALNLLGGLGSFNTEVAKFGLNLNAGNGNTHTLSDKWEGLGLVPCLDGANPNDFFLFVGNDNNFQSVTGKYLGSLGTVQSYNAGLAHDSMVLAYRVRLVAPAISVFNDGAPLSDGSGTVNVGTSLASVAIQKQLFVQNSGTTALTGLTTSITGTDAADFVVTASPVAPLASTATTPLTVTFQSPTEGTKSAVLHVLSNAPGSTASFDIPLSGIVIASSPVRLWRSTYLGSAASVGQAADTADFDNDGLANLLEYGLGSLPTTQSPNARPSASIPDSPTLLASRLTLTFETADSTPTDLIYTVQITDSLEAPVQWTDLAQKTGSGAWTWLAGGTARIVTTLAAGRTTVHVADPILHSPLASRHMRLKVTLAP